MGLYITAWFEGKDKKGNWFLANPRFVNYNNPDKVNPPMSLDLRMDKNYLLYAALGDVRNDYSIPYIQRLRGIPKDATDVVKFVWEVYLTLLHICYGVRNDEENYLDIDNTRLIFWFE